MSADDPFGSRKNNVFTEMLSKCISEYMKDNVSTSVPGNVLSFDPSTQMAEVQIGLKMHTEADEHIDRSPTIYVPVNFWGASGGTLECKVEAGTEGVLFFSQECIDSWVDQGGVAVKSDPRRFSQDDAFFIPGFRSRPGAIKDFANNGIRLRNNAASSYVWVKDDGSIEINGTLLNVLCPARFEADVDTMAALRNFLIDVGYLHTHVGVEAGDDISGPVNPA